MLIGELAKKSNCPHDTIRFYEKLGLIEGNKTRGSTNSYKHYSEQMLERIQLIKQAKLLGFTLAEIKDLIVAWETNALSRGDKINLFQEKIALIDQRINELKQVKRYLNNKLKKIISS